MQKPALNLALNEDVPEILDKAAANRRALLQRALHATGA